jgi:hypothetical protein
MLFRQVLVLAIPFVTLAACSTDTLVNDKVLASGDGCAPGVPSGMLMVESYLPMPEGEALHVRVNGQDLISGSEDPRWLEILSSGGGVGAQLPAGDYTIELLGRDNRLWASAGPVTVVAEDNVSRVRHSTVRIYGDPANPSVFLSDPTEHDTSAETTEVTVRNGTPTGEAVIVARCVAAGVVGQPDPCEDLATVAGGDTWSGSVLNTYVSYPFIGEAYVAVRLDAPDSAGAGGSFSVNQNPENALAYGTGCQATGMLVYDVLTLQCDGRRSAIAASDCGWD